MPSSSDSLRSAGSNGLNGRIASVWPARGAASRGLGAMANKAIAAITAISTAAPAPSSTIRRRAAPGVALGGGRDAGLRDARHDRRIATRDLRDEAIAPAGYRRDVAILAARFAQHLTQGRDVLREAVLLDDHARPDRAQQHVLVERLARVLDEIHQRVEHLGREQGRLSRVPAQQALLADIQGEIAELVVGARSGSWAREGPDQNKITTFSPLAKRFFHRLRCMVRSESHLERADWRRSMTRSTTGHSLSICRWRAPWPGPTTPATSDDTDRRCSGEPCAAVFRGLVAFFDRDLRGLDGNGRSCADCHMVTEQFRLTPSAVEARFQRLQKRRRYNRKADDPLFRPIDADDFRINGEQATDYSNLRQNGLIRVVFALPANIRLIDPATNAPSDERTVDIWRMVPGVTDVKLTGSDGLNPWPRGPNQTGGFQLDGRFLTLQEQALGALLSHAQIHNQPQPRLLDDLSSFQRVLFTNERVRALSAAIDSGCDAVAGCRSAAQRTGTARQGGLHSLVRAVSRRSRAIDGAGAGRSLCTTSSRSARGPSTRVTPAALQLRCRARRGSRATREPTKSRCPTARRYGEPARIPAAHC